MSLYLHFLISQQEKEQTQANNSLVLRIFVRLNTIVTQYFMT